MYAITRQIIKKIILENTFLNFNFKNSEDKAVINSLTCYSSTTHWNSNKIWIIQHYTKVTIRFTVHAILLCVTYKGLCIKSSQNTEWLLNGSPFKIHSVKADTQLE